LEKLGFMIINVAIVVIIYMIYAIVKNDTKRQTHYSFLAVLVSIFIWTLGTLILEYYYMATGTVSNIALNIAYIGLILTPPFTLLLGMVFAKSDRIHFSWKYILLFAIPILSIILLLTNSQHHLFYNYIKYEELTFDGALGRYFNIHTIYSYGCTLVGMVLMIVSSIKSAGLFSRQSICILLGILTTFAFNLLLTMQILKAYFYTNIIAIFFSLVFFFIAMFKFKFLDLIPIALHRIVNIISDGYVVLNEKNEVIDFNNAFVNNIKVSQGENFIDRLKVDQFVDILPDKLMEVIEEVKNTNKMVTLPQKSLTEKEEKYFDVEVSAIFLQNEYRGTILLFKDITELKKSQNAMIEQERLASLGQLAGGMAHDINTPIATIRMGIDFFNGKYPYTEQEEKMLSAMKISASKITEIVESVRNQIRNTGESQKTDFLLSKVIDNIKILVNNELEKNRCKLLVNMDEEINLYGDFGKLSQVIMNIVMNAIQAYNGEHGEVKVSAYTESDNAVISIIDNAGGIPQKIADGLFKEILTTKGTKGTGFGLYFAKSMVRAEFNGDITFETEEGKGTAFYIRIPIKKEEQ